MDWTSLSDYLLDHASGIIGATGAVAVLFRQSKGQQRLLELEIHVKEVKSDLRSEVGSALVQSVSHGVISTIKPVLQAEAVVAADKVVRQAADVACVLAKKKEESWDGVERRTGVPDRRSGPVDRRGTDKKE